MLSIGAWFCGMKGKEKTELCPSDANFWGMTRVVLELYHGEVSILLEKRQKPHRNYPQTSFCIVTENTLLPWQKSLLGPAVIMSVQENCSTELMLLREAGGSGEVAAENFSEVSSGEEAFAFRSRKGSGK